jgi:hypothetical protein
MLALAQQALSLMIELLVPVPVPVPLAQQQQGWLVYILRKVGDTSRIVDFARRDFTGGAGEQVGIFWSFASLGLTPSRYVPLRP